MNENVTLDDFYVDFLGRPSCPGVYALWAQDFFFSGGVKHLLYIGSSDNIALRLRDNRGPYLTTYSRLGGSVWPTFYETPDHIALKKRLIEKHKPWLNKQFKR